MTTRGAAAEEDYYGILEIPQDADQREIARAFRRMALRFHPDKVGVDHADRFLAINRAYEVLVDEGRRAEYDEGLRAAQAAQTARESERAEKRKLREALEKREAEAKRARGPEALARERALQAEIARLRADGEALLRAREAQRARALAAARHTSAIPEHVLLIKWMRKRHPQTAQSIARIFGRFGEIERLEVVPDAGRAYLLYALPAVAERVVAELDDDSLLAFLISFALGSGASLADARGARASDELARLWGGPAQVSGESIPEADGASGWTSRYAHLLFNDYAAHVLRLLDQKIAS